MSAFHIDGRIGLKMEYELAIRLGEFINKMKPMDRQIAALGARLAQLDEQGPSQWNSDLPSYKEDEDDEREMLQGVTLKDIGEKFAVSNSMHHKVNVVRSEKANKVRWGH